MHDITKKRFATVLIVVVGCIFMMMSARTTLPTTDVFPANTTRHALVSLLTVEGPQAWWAQKKYIASAHKLAHTFRAHSNQDMALIVVDEFRALRKADEQRLRESVWMVHRVQSGLVPRSEAWNHYLSSKMFSKLMVWRLTMYEQILYTDLDTVFTQSPKRLFQMRLSSDNPAMVLHTSHRQYYNAGVIVLRPSEDEYQRLVSAMNANTHTGEHAEQDFLNIFYHSRIVQLDRRFNTQVCAKEGCVNDRILGHHPFDKWVEEHKTVILHFGGNNKPWDLHNCLEQGIVQLCLYWKRR
jgi:lipopolysaccharide biosynthesis glycosyltransferase